ncbi:hypothetical protein [Holospora undulata]|uniref:Uncharacterized protein n=1 Tax=Holospora undulata HU1 TaxID=1321371 RepID=A0A061JH43_9PROT|nr:hypothetical protein [Holospora undulata]ETZ04523.1 hypothetical protein K737_301064 [Holospora undulata HU1]
MKKKILFYIFFAGGVNQCFPLSGFCMDGLSKDQKTFEERQGDEESKKEVEGYKTVRMVKEILFSGNYDLADQALRDSTFNQKVNNLADDNLCSLMNGILFSDDCVLAKKFLDGVSGLVNLKERIKQFRYNDFVDFVRGIMLSKNSDCAKEVLKTVNLKEKISEFSGRDFVNFLDFVLSSQEANFSDEVFQACDLKERVREFSSTLKQHGITKKLFQTLAHNNNAEGAGVLYLIDCDGTRTAVSYSSFQGSKLTFSNEDFMDLIRSVLRSKNVSLAKKALQSIDLKEVADKLEGIDCSFLVSTIVHAQNFELAKEAFQAIDLKKIVDSFGGYNYGFADFMRRVLSSNNSDLVKQILKTTDFEKIVTELDDGSFDFLLRGFLISGKSDFFDCVFRSVNLEERVGKLEQYYFPNLLVSTLNSKDLCLGRRILNAMNFQEAPYHLDLENFRLNLLMKEIVKSSSPLSVEALSRLDLKRLVEKFDDGSLCCLLSAIVTSKNFDSANCAAQSIDLRESVGKLKEIDFVNFLKDGVLLSENFDLTRKVLDALNFKEEVPNLSKSDLRDLKERAMYSRNPVSEEVLRQLNLHSHLNSESLR